MALEYRNLRQFSIFEFLMWHQWHFWQCGANLSSRHSSFYKNYARKYFQFTKSLQINIFNWLEHPNTTHHSSISFFIRLCTEKKCINDDLLENKNYNMWAEKKEGRTIREFTHTLHVCFLSVCFSRSHCKIYALIMDLCVVVFAKLETGPFTM